MFAYFLTCDLTFVMNVFAGLKAGILCAGMMMVVFFDIFLAVFFAPPLEWMYISAILPRSIWLQTCGLVLILLGLALLIWARSHLRGLYSGHVEIQADHRLVSSGPYRRIRHPSYAGFLLLVLGVALGYSSLIGLLAIPIFLLPGLAYRMSVEEKLLGEQFGDEYSAYQVKTKRLIPGIW